MSLVTFARAIPKAELHLHLEGSVRPETFSALAEKHGIALPVDDVTQLYAYDNLPDFLTIYDLVCRCMRDADDFRRTTYEAMESCAEGGGRHLELFFSAHAHFANGISYGAMLDGILAGMAEAEADFGMTALLIPAHSRELGPAAGEDFLDMVLADRREKVVGIGLDYNEAPFPPGPFAAMYARARAAGLHVTAHAGEGGPAANVRDSLDLLKVERIDHGYHVVDDPALVARCRDEGVFFTCCPSTATVTTGFRDLASPDHAIRRMIDAGLRVTINSDDPPMFFTSLGREYERAAAELKMTAAELKAAALTSVEASWLGADDKRARIAAWGAEIDALAADHLAPAGTVTA